MILAAALLIALAGQSPAPASPVPGASTRPMTCSASLKTCQAARAETDLKLQDEMERADIQNYLTRVELGVTKQKLAAALAKCGAACAPSAPAAPAATPSR